VGVAGKLQVRFDERGAEGDGPFECCKGVFRSVAGSSAMRYYQHDLYFPACIGRKGSAALLFTHLC
jgi:hypothetical protein